MTTVDIGRARRLYITTQVTRRELSKKIREDLLAYCSDTDTRRANSWVGDRQAADAAEGKEATAEPSCTAEKKVSETNDKTGEVKCAKVATAAKDIEMKDAERKDETLDGHPGLAAAAEDPGKVSGQRREEETHCSKD